MNQYPRTDRSQIAVEESFVVDVQSYLQELMELRGLNRSQLAAAMGVSRARVTQIFSDECTNLTVRLLARAAHALGEEPEISSQSVRHNRAERQKARQTKIIEACDNVVPLGAAWVDMSSYEEITLQPCAEHDERLDALVERVRMTAGAR